MEEKGEEDHGDGKEICRRRGVIMDQTVYLRSKVWRPRWRTADILQNIVRLNAD